jgi:hypothetical protein
MTHPNCCGRGFGDGGTGSGFLGFDSRFRTEGGTAQRRSGSRIAGEYAEDGPSQARCGRRGDRGWQRRSRRIKPARVGPRPPPRHRGSPTRIPSTIEDSSRVSQSHVSRFPPSCSGSRLRKPATDLTNLGEGVSGLAIHQRDVTEQRNRMRAQDARTAFLRRNDMRFMKERVPRA